MQLSLTAAPQAHGNNRINHLVLFVLSNRMYRFVTTVSKRKNNLLTTTPSNITSGYYNIYIKIVTNLLYLRERGLTIMLSRVHLFFKWDHMKVSFAQNRLQR